MKIVKLLTGNNIYVHDVDMISNWIENNKRYYEESFLNHISSNFNNQKNIIDIGANIGNHSHYFLNTIKFDNLYCFEPFEANFNILKKNVEKFKNRCYLNQIALSNENGTKPLFNSESGNNGGFSLHNYQIEGANKSFLVEDSIEVRTLDSYNLNNITMIKIDVENHENEVLEGAFKTIKRNKPIIFVENLYYSAPLVCPDVDVHKKIFDKLNYKRVQRNIVGSLMDLWVPNNY